MNTPLLSVPKETAIDEFTNEGISYIAKESNNCIGCAFEGKSDECAQSPICLAKLRTDGRNIIWVVKQNEQEPTE